MSGLSSVDGYLGFLSMHEGVEKRQFIISLSSHSKFVPL